MSDRVTDFYDCEWFIEGHQIAPQMSVDEINHELIELKRIWNKREDFAPEKARRALSVLDDARATFRNEQSKNRYDIQLAQQKQRTARSAGGFQSNNSYKSPNEGKKQETPPQSKARPTTQPIHRSRSALSKPGMFWFLTLSTVIGIQAFVWLQWGDQLLNYLFGGEVSSFGLGIASGISSCTSGIAMSIGPWGFIICSMIALLIYNTKLSKNGLAYGYKWYHYLLSILMSIGGSVAWALLVLAVTIFLIILVVGIIVIIIIAAASGS